MLATYLQGAALQHPYQERIPLVEMEEEDESYTRLVRKVGHVQQRRKENGRV